MDKTLEDSLEKFFSKYKTAKYQKNEVILSPSENVNYVGYVKSGYVRVYTLNEKGQEVTMQIFKPMLYFTMIFTRNKVENNFYFEAITPVEMHKAPIDEAWEFFNNNPEVLSMVQTHIFQGLLEVAHNFGFLMSGNAYNKVALTSASLADRMNITSGNKKINFAVTHKLIASLTGLTRETVTLQMLRLEKEGLIKNMNRKIIVLDKEGLVKASRSDN